MTSTTTKSTIDSSANWSTITEEFAKKLGVEIIGNSHESQNNYRVVSSIRRQVLDKKIWISLHRLLEIVKPEIQQEIINAIANPNITKQCCKIARKKIILSDSSSSSSTESGSEYSSIDENEIRTQVLEAKKRN